MSDRESLWYDAVLEELADIKHAEYQAELQELVEATLVEILRGLDIDELLKKQEHLEPYGNPLHAALTCLVDAVQEDIGRISKQRADALQKAIKNRGYKTKEFWEDRTQEALKKKHANTKLSAREIAKRVIDDEIKNENITNEQDLKYLKDTVVDTFRKRLGRNAEFKAIK